MRKTYQNEIWGIKKDFTFNKRLYFDALSQLIFALEKEALKAIIFWTKSGFRYQDILKQVNHLKNKLFKIENYIVSASGLKKPILDVQGLSVVNLSRNINNILVKKPFYTFPEKYRWRDD